METKAKIQMVLVWAVCVSILAFSLGCATTEKPPAIKATPQQETIDEPYIAIMAVTATEESGGQVEWSQSWAGYTPEEMDKMQVTTVAFPTGNEATSLILLRRIMPVKVLLEGEYAFEYHVTNLTDLTHQNVTIEIEGTRNLSIVSSSPQAMEGLDGSLRWVIGNLAPHQTKVVRVRAGSEFVGEASDCISVSYANALCGRTLVVDPDLLLVKTARTDGYICDDFWFTYEIVNPGSGMANNIHIRDEIPTGFRTIDGNKAVVEIDAGDLAPGERKEFTVKAKGVETGKHSSVAVATADGGLISKSENIGTLIYQPVLMIEANSPAAQYLGRNVGLTYTVMNVGDAVAKNTVVTAVIPERVANLVEAFDNGTVDQGKVTWRLGDLEVDESETVSLKINGVRVGQGFSTVSANAECAARVEDSTATVFLGIPAMLLELVDNGDPAPIDGTVTYTVTITNQGSAPDTNIKIICEMPFEQQYLSAEGPTQGMLRGRTLTFAPLSSLDAGATKQWKIRVRAKDVGDVRFGVTMTSDQLEEKVLETEATTIY